MNSKIISLFIILSVLLIENTCQEVPCPDVFKYIAKGNRTYGLITIPPSRVGQWTNLNVFVGTNGIVTNNDRWLHLEKSRNESAEDALNGKNIRYYLLLPVSSEVPVIKYIYLNGKLVCRGPFVFYHNNWSFQHSFLFGKTQVRTVHTSNREEYYDTFFDWMVQPRPISFTQNEKLTEPSSTTEDPKMVPSPMISIVPRMPHDGRWTENLPFQCGKMAKTVERKVELSTSPLILNGVEVIKSEFPWLAYLQYNERTAICGGTLISDRHIVTAAHCVKGRTVIDVYLGKHDRSTMEEGSVRRQPRDIIIHQDYKKDEPHADIAIILIDPVQFSREIRPACIWPFGILFDQFLSNATVAGWGTYMHEHPASQVPMKTTVPIVSLEMCRQSTEHYQALATDTIICAGGQNSGPCHGDSGSGLYIQNDNTWYIRGVVSTSLRDRNTNYCQTNHYALYVDIAFYLNWLRTIIMNTENEIMITRRILNNRPKANLATIEIDPQ